MAQSYSSAFTLPELLMTLAIFAFTLVFAIPALQTFTQNNRLKAASQSLTNTLRYARQTALENGYSVQVCPFSASGSVSCGSSFSQGWIAVGLDSSTTLLQGDSISGSNITVSATQNNITFYTTGMASSNTRITLCDKRGASYARSIAVSLTGAVQAGSTPGQAVWGGGLTCP